MLRPVNRARKAVPIPLPAPVGGLNARDALAAMMPGDASVMTNVFPYADRVATRKGFSTVATAAEYKPGGGLSSRQGFRQLISYAHGATPFAIWPWEEAVVGVLVKKLRIYSINAGLGTLTNVREVVTTGGNDNLTSVGEWTRFTTASGASYVLLCVSQTIAGTPTFTPTAYDGSSWSVPAITNVPVDTYGVHAHRARLWFYGGASPTKPLSAWYLPVGAIAGAAVEFNVGPFATRGGKLVAMRTWTLDGGTGGTDDLAVFLTDRGQAIVYAGTDPSSAATWTLVGVFDVGFPASKNGPLLRGASGPATGETSNFITDCFAMKYGNDLLLNLGDGVNSANKVLRSGGEAGDYTISAKIRPLLSDLAVTNGQMNEEASAAFMWKMCYLPTRKQLLLAVPTACTDTVGLDSSTTVVTACAVYAMNTETGAWAKFDGMNILDMIPVGNEMYFIDGSQKIFKYGIAADDNGTAITFECRQAYSYMNAPTNKLVTLMQPMLRATGNFSLTVQADADFNPGTISSYTSYTVGAEQNLQPVISPAKYGRAFAAHLKGQTSAGVVSWYSTNWIAKLAGLV